VSLFWREKPDGRRAPGYAVYLLGGLGAVAAVLVLHRRLEGAGRPSTHPGRDRGADVAAITQPAAMMAPVKVASKAAPAGDKSYRLGARSGRAATADSGPGSGSEAFDAISAALAEAPRASSDPPGRKAPARALDAGGAEPEYAPLPPAFPLESARPGKGAPETRDERTGLLGYRDSEADPAPPETDRKPAVPSPEPSGDWLPRGTLVPTYLLTTVDTGNPAAVIQFGVARDVVFHRRCELAFGTRFLGRFRGRPMRGRLNLAAETVLFPDGMELPANASAVEADESGAHVRPGVAAEYFPPPAWVRAAPYASDFFTGFMSLLESRAQSPWAVGAAGVGVPASTDGLRAPLYQASAQAMQDFTQARLKEMEERYAPYYLIPSGSACWLQLDADLDLAAARSGRRAPAAVADGSSSNRAFPHASEGSSAAP